MPRDYIELDAETAALLQRIQEQQGLESLDQAAEWLLRRRLRRGARTLTGRGRALYLVKKSSSQQ